MQEPDGRHQLPAVNLQARVVNPAKVFVLDEGGGGSAHQAARGLRTSTRTRRLPAFWMVARMPAVIRPRWLGMAWMRGLRPSFLFIGGSLERKRPASRCGCGAQFLEVVI